jgi:uncharacterized membrane protein (UPF0127 family)
MRSVLPSLFALTALAACAGDTIKASDRPPSTVAFEGTDAVLYVEIADDAEEQQRGLMGVERLPADQGMAFVWAEPVASTFWMKNTLIPLSIAFVDEGGHIVGIRDMEPCATEPCPHYGIDESYVLAIEANLGWFDDHGVDVGDRAELRTSLYG